ncbi:MAG: hypothetical protein ACOCU4_04155 [Alkalispirochaeta sp.]
MRYKTLIIRTVLLIMATFPVAGQERTAESIAVAVLDLQPTGGLAEEEVTTINEYFRGRISELPNYNVVDQSNIRELMEVNELQQLSGLFEGNQAPEQLQITGADQIVIGSIGRLLEQVVITVRLVEIQTGEIAFSYTAHTNEDDLFLRLDEIVERIRGYGLLLSQEITVSGIADLVSRRRYAAAQERLDAFLRQQRRRDEPVPTTREFLALREEIRDNLYEDYFKTARRARRRDDFVEARRAITRAIALRPSSDALEERDRIQLAEEEYQREIERQERLIRLRADEQDRQEAAGVYLSPLDAVGVFLTTINTRPTRLSLIAVSAVEPALDIPTEVENWGLGYGRTFQLLRRDQEPALLEIRPIARVGLDVEYRTTNDVNALVLHPVLTPHTGFTVHLLNILLSAGIDGGVHTTWGSDGGSTWHVSPSVGLWAVGDVMILRSLGVHLGARVDYLFHPPPLPAGAAATSPFLVRIRTGVSL